MCLLQLLSHFCTKYLSLFIPYHLYFYTLIYSMLDNHCHMGEHCLCSLKTTKPTGHYDHKENLHVENLKNPQQNQPTRTNQSCNWQSNRNVLLGAKKMELKMIFCLQVLHMPCIFMYSTKQLFLCLQS